MSRNNRLFNLLIAPVPIIGGWVVGRCIAASTLSPAVERFGDFCAIAGVAVGLYFLVGALRK